MKKINYAYRIFALTIAILMFATSVNLVVDMHYCQGELKTFSLLGKAETCHDKQAAMANCPHHKKMQEQSATCSKDEKRCCDNKTVFIQVDNDLINASSKFVHSQELQQFVVAFVEVFFKNVFVEDTTPSYLIYQPPIVWRDIPVLHQSFLL